MVKSPLYFIFVLALLLVPSLSWAAIIGITPENTTRTSGSTFSVNIYVSSANTSVNAVSGVLSFPSDVVEVVGINKEGSVVNFWVQEPASSNAKGTVSFEGVILNPGYRGSNGQILTVTFRAKKPGQIALNFSSSSVLANDGLGTNVITGTIPGKVSIVSVTPQVEPVQTESPKTEIPKKEDTVVMTGIRPHVPIITQYDKLITSGSGVVVQGLSNPGVRVVLDLILNGKTIQSKESYATGSGDFIIILDPIYAEGQYSFSVYAVDEASNKSDATTEFLLKVRKSIKSNFQEWVVNYTIVVLIVLLCVAGLAIVTFFVWCKTISIIRKLRREVIDAEKVSKQSFVLLHSAIRDHISKVKRHRKVLTSEELDFIHDLEKRVKEVEKTVSKEIKDIIK